MPSHGNVAWFYVCVFTGGMGASHHPENKGHEFM